MNEGIFLRTLTIACWLVAVLTIAGLFLTPLFHRETLEHYFNQPPTVGDVWFIALWIVILGRGKK